MDRREVEEKVALLCQRFPRFDAQAYFFLFEALDHSIVTLGKAQQEGIERHVTGGELLRSIRVVAQKQFGWLAKTVFNTWGVEKTEDFGQIVFIMVEEKLLHKQDNDSMDDFTGGYDFSEAFEDEYDFDIPWDTFTKGLGA